jgi:D-alanyl-D-alanine carboxypeptidase/D-alanyl-D-alanine-endopeptidase (penicillin-binding protein 4)
MRISVLIIFLSISCFLEAQTIEQLKQELTIFLKDADLKNASIGFYAEDLTNNQVLGEINPDQSLVPASITKLITTATSLELFDANHRFTTSLYYNGSIDLKNKILHGNIVIKGGGDPALGSHRYEKVYGNFMNKWANEIKALGIDSINGKVIADASYFNEQMIPSTWIWGDLGNYYGAGPSGLSIHENMCMVEFVSGKNKGDSTVISCVKPFVPDLEIENLVKSGDTHKDESNFYGGPYQYNKMVKGNIPLNKKDFVVKSSIPDPAFLASYELTTELKNIGIKTADSNSTSRLEKDNSSYVSEHLISSIQSPQITELIQQVNYHSINLYAEHLLNHIGVKKMNSGDVESGTAAELEFWKSKGIDVSGMYLNDGSGLSRFNGFTSKQLVKILSYMKQSKNYESFYQSLPIAGKSGTVRSVGIGSTLEGNARIKSGYMTRVRSYAGYLKTKSNRTVGFVIMVNNFNCSAQVMKNKMEKLMVKLAEIND